MRQHGGFGALPTAQTPAVLAGTDEGIRFHL